MRGGNQAADNGDAASLSGNAFRGLAIASHKRRSLDQVPGRVATDRQLGEQDETGAGDSRLLREVDDLSPVAGEISNCGIDLSQRDLHSSSVKGRCAGAKSGECGEGARAYTSSGYLGWAGPSWPSGSGGGPGIGLARPAGEAVSTSSPGRRSEGAFGGRTSGSEELLATVGGRSTSRSVWMIFWPSTFMLSRRTTSSPTRRTKSTSCGGSP